MRIGIDTGGTFTDFVAVHTDGRVESFKIPSNPHDPASVILVGIERITGKRSAVIVHGSTVATNALLERKGARTAFVTTEGFEDLFHIARQNRRELYNLTPVPVRPLVSASDCFGVPERALFDGTILRRPTAAELQRLRRKILRSGAESVAICFLHSYRSLENERAVEKALVGLDFVCTSTDISPEFREYERASTTVLNAYVGPLMRRYLTALVKETSRHSLSILQSNGGSMRPDEAQRLAVRTLLSGPAGGVNGASWMAAQSGYKKVLAFDMGGTSTDVCLIDGAPKETTEVSIDGFPVRIPMFDIHTVGAGGGSMARVDEGGLLRVGPQSAGANPGPACYGIGDQPTVTDAHVILGRISQAQLAGGTVSIDPSLSRQAFDRLRSKLKMTAVKAAEGVIRVANANMERAIRTVSVERGRDPREFALVAFGGGGGLHACEIAESLDIVTVLVPQLAGALSALGMLVADRVRDYSLGVLNRPDIDDLFGDLEVLAQRENARAKLKRSADLRYVGQSYELNVPWANERTAKLFHMAHQEQYGYSNPEKAIEIVTIRLRATERMPKPKLPGASVERQNPKTTRRIYVSGRWREIPVLTRNAVGHRGLKGPALIVDYGSTTLVPANWSAKIDEYGAVILTKLRKSGTL